MTAEEVIDKLYEVADEDGKWRLDQLTIEAGLRAPLVSEENGPITGGELFPLNDMEA